jgi:DNA mismatch endonuclease (patch repair protein)
MAAIRGRDTRPEIALRKALWRAGVRGWRCRHRIGRSEIDIAFTRWRVAVFVDGAFWHGHPSKWQPGRWTGYWDAKIRRNIERDREHTAALEADGWRVIRVWEFEVSDDVDGVVERITTGLGRQRGAGEVS